MKEEIPKLKQMMKDLTDIKDKVKSGATKAIISTIIIDIKDLAEILDY